MSRSEEEKRREEKRGYWLDMLIGLLIPFVLFSVLPV